MKIKNIKERIDRQGISGSFKRALLLFLVWQKSSTRWSERQGLCSALQKDGGRGDDGDGGGNAGDDDGNDVQEAEGGRLETFLICAGPGAQPTLVKRLTFRS